MTTTAERIKPRTRSSAHMARGASSGAFVRLSDPEIKPGVEALKERLRNDPKAAQQWLQELGYLTPTGRITKRYSVR